MVGKVETFQSEGQWQNRVDEVDSVGTGIGSQAEAVKVGREQARELHATHLIQNEDGVVVGSNSYDGNSGSAKG